MPTKSNRTSKITIRQPISLKRRVEQAAASRGMTVTSFINSALAAAAEQSLSQVRRRELTERDQHALLEMLTHAKGPNRALLAAARRFRARYGA